jgi:hypothetical protein
MKQENTTAIDSKGIFLWLIIVAHVFVVWSFFRRKQGPGNWFPK